MICSYQGQLERMCDRFVLMMTVGFSVAQSNFVNNHRTIDIKIQWCDNHHGRGQHPNGTRGSTYITVITIKYIWKQATNYTESTDVDSVFGNETSVIWGYWKDHIHHAGSSKVTWGKYRTFGLNGDTKRSNVEMGSSAQGMRLTTPGFTGSLQK